MSQTIPYLYKWTHIPTGKWYIGSKTQSGWNPSMHEKYICSSKIVKPMILENRTDWIYEILVIGPGSYIRNLEKKYLKLLDAKNNPMSFNRSNACCEFIRTGVKESTETRFKKSIARQGQNNPMFGLRGELSPHFGKTHSEETKKKQSEALKEYNKNRPKEHNSNISKALRGNPKLSEKMKGEKNPMFGKPASEKSKLMSKLKNSGENNPMRRPENQKQCEYCGKIVAKNHYTMFHGPKCKSLLT